MFREEEVKYLEEQIKKQINSIENTYLYEYTNYTYYNEQEEYPGYTKGWLKERIKDLYNLIKAYFEVKGLSIYLNDFIKKFEDFVNNKESKLLQTELLHSEGGDELKVIIDFKRALEPFKAFDYNKSHEEEQVKLSNLLKNTDFILKNTLASINNEADIYKQVKWVLGLYYPSCRHVNKASFIKEFSTYHPDILIPELKTAIEYKYIRDKAENIDKYLDAVKIDATNYTEDFRYDHFIAVLYIKDTSIATEQAIHVAWEQKKFPENWRLVIAMGS